MDVELACDGWRAARRARGFDGGSTATQGAAWFGTDTLQIVDERPGRAGWERTVGLFAGAVGRGRIDKVVSARRVVFRDYSRPRRVGGPPAPCRDCTGVHDVRVRPRDEAFLGATPERLVRTAGRSFETVAIAGSAARGVDPSEDERFAAALLASEKDREEHAVVVDMLRSSLTPIVETLQLAETPAILPLRHLQHLVTPITGTTRDEAGLLALAGQLHPTPAVGGAPRDVALALIEEHEGFDRGWYAGPIGWLGADGDGELMVALRCGLVRDGGDAVLRLRHRGRLRPGAGVGGVPTQAPDDDRRARRGRRTGEMTDVLALRAMVEALVEAGVTDVIVCPGSRSTPLALATRAHPDLCVRVLLDERSAGFFALGLARASRRPVAVVVTSGTAVANLLPAVVEASLARVPLVLLTADRPPELRDRGAPQTIDQVRIFGGNVRWFAECRCSTARRKRGGTLARSSAERWPRPRLVRPVRSISTSGSESRSSRQPHLDHWRHPTTGSDSLVRSRTSWPDRLGWPRRIWRTSPHAWPWSRAA